ncbi:MAG: ImmA/IrrE family metallo-endopeptidase [Ruminiclostridium sp.]|nr:ImmA/IrrE family metallo-endopeptidase [Ruminiclostridium sp.]
MNSEQIHSTVRRLIRENRTGDPFSLARSLGIDVDCADLGELKGFYVVYGTGRYIVLNHNLSERMSRLVLAHEIGHDTLHRDIAANGGMGERSFFDMTAKPEREANIFAAELLISDEEMTELGERGFTIDEAAAEIGVHTQAAMIKARSMQERGFGINVPYITNDLFKGA